MFAKLRNMDEYDRILWKGFLIGMTIATAVLSPCVYFFFKIMILKFYWFR